MNDEQARINAAAYQSWIQEKARRMEMESALENLLSALANLHASWTSATEVKKSLGGNKYEKAAVLGAYGNDEVTAMELAEAEAHRVLSNIKNPE